jgi:octanoyl-[GcvH]:protein N-octanoyltransferase
MELLRDARPDDPVLDVAITHALLREVGAGERDAVARVFRPGPTMAFGRLDALAPGYDAARAAAQQHGFTPALRLGGGHAAGYDAGSVLVEIIRPNATIARGIPERFADLTALLVETLGHLGITARVGELPGEYCAGDWSVNAAGIKLAGLSTAMVLVEHGAALRAALTDVYAALDLAWRPGTAGAGNDIVRALTAGDAQRALIAALAQRESLTSGTLAASTVARAETLRASHER